VRVITTSSLGNRFGRLRLDDLEWRRRRYGGGWIAYSTTKLMNILFTRELARRTRGTGLEAYCFHPTSEPGRRRRTPGAHRTRFASASRPMRLLPGPVLDRIALTAEDGAEPLVRLAGARGAGRERHLFPRPPARRPDQPAGRLGRAGPPVVGGVGGVRPE